MLRFRKMNRGMTMAELVVSIGILIVVMVAVSMFEYNVINYNRSSQVSLTNAEEAQNLLKYASKEMRAMVPSANGSYPIASTATSSITFFSDVDSDNTIEQVRYYLASSTLYRGITKPSGSPAVYNLANETKYVFATGVRNTSTTPVFEYYTSSYNGPAEFYEYPSSISTIRLIKMNITIDSDPNKWPVPRTFTTQISLRNLKSNL